MSETSCTGIRLQGGHVEWTLLRTRKGRLDSPRFKEIELEHFEEADKAARSAELKPALSGVQGALCGILSAEHAVMRVVDLPSKDPQELADMAMLQVDKFAPFPSDQLYLACEVLEQRGETSRTLVAAVRKEAVDELGELFTASGHPLQQVDLDILALWALIRDDDKVLDEGWDFHIFDQRNCVYMVAVLDGQPRMFRCLGNRPVQSGQAVEDFLDELEYTLMMLETECGILLGGRICCWVQEDFPNDLQEGLQRIEGLQVEQHNRDQLAPLSESAAFRGLHRTPLMADFTPVQWKSNAKQKALIAKLLYSSAAFFAVWLIVVLGFLGTLNIRQARLSSRRDAVVALEVPADEVRALRKQVRSLELYADRSHSALEIMRDISVRLPDGIDLTSFVYRKGEQMALRGEASEVDPIYAFFKSLEESELYGEVEQSGIDSKNRRGQPVSEFKVSADLSGEESK